MQIKYEAPENFGGMSIKGEPVVLEADGTITAEGEQAEALIAHGFKPAKKWNEQEQKWD